LGLVERINIYGFYAWMSVLAVVTLKEVGHGIRSASLRAAGGHNLPRPAVLATTR